MSSQGLVSCWIERLLQGDQAAVQWLWDRYFHRLVQLARKKLRDSPRRVADEEDVALSAFDSFCRDAEHGQFPDLHNRDSLWRLLVIITCRKVAHLVRDNARKKRGGGKSFRPLPPASCFQDSVFEQILSRDPSPDFAAEMAEQCTVLLRSLDDFNLEKVARWRMEGYTVEEIAQKLHVVPRSVKRKLQVIRHIWKKEVECR